MGWFYAFIFQGTETSPTTFEKISLSNPPHQDIIIFEWLHKLSSKILCEEIPCGIEKHAVL